MTVATVFTWVWDNFGKETLKWGWKTAQWKRAAQLYDSRIRQDYGKLYVLGQADAKPLGDLYTAVRLLNRVTAFERFAPTQLQELMVERGGWSHKSERLDGIGLVQKGGNLFILGKPGAGKTTFLKQLTIKAADGELKRTVDKQWVELLPEKVQRKLANQREVTQIPLFISLNQHSDSGRTLLESVEYELANCNFPAATPFVEHLLHSGRALVLWDGLDEVNQEGEKRSQLIQAMKDFMRRYRASQFVITCRVAASEYSFQHVDYIEMADFDEKQMQTFINNWFDKPVLAERCWAELQKGGNRGLRELAQQPLLLTLLCITFEKTLTLPQRRVEIYEEAIDALLKEWDARRHIKRDEPYQGLSHGRRKQLLARVANHSFFANKLVQHQNNWAKEIATYIQQVTGDEEVDGVAILRAIAAQHGMFVERAKNIFSFAHLTFQEYFTAKYIVDNARRGTLKRLLDHITDPQWKEVLLLTASQLDEADDFFKLFAKRLNQLVEDVAPVQQVLVWAKNKQMAIDAKQFGYRQIALRAIFLALDRTRVIGNDYDPAHPFVINFAHASDSRHVIDIARDFGLSYAFDLDLDLDLAPDIPHNITHAIDLVDRISAESPHHAQAEQLLQKLAGLSFPKEDATDTKWEAYAAELVRIRHGFGEITGMNLINQCAEDSREMLDAIKWTVDDIKKYRDCLTVTTLYLECLDLAVVADKAGLQELLLLPASVTHSA